MKRHLEKRVRSALQAIGRSPTLPLHLWRKQLEDSYVGLVPAGSVRVFLGSGHPAAGRSPMGDAAFGTFAQALRQEARERQQECTSIAAIPTPGDESTAVTGLAHGWASPRGCLGAVVLQAGARGFRREELELLREILEGCERDLLPLLRERAWVECALEEVLVAVEDLPDGIALLGAGGTVMGRNRMFRELLRDEDRAIPLDVAPGTEGPSSSLSPGGVEGGLPAGTREDGEGLRILAIREVVTRNARLTLVLATPPSLLGNLGVERLAVLVPVHRLLAEGEAVE